MKIYNKIITNMETGIVVFEDSLDYQGEIVLCGGGGGTTVEAPQPSAEERALQAYQLKLLEKQSAESEAMKPFLLKSMGLRMDDTGKLVRMTEEEKRAGMSEIDLAQYDLTLSAQERQRKAYAGELDISPALEKSLTDQEAQIKEALSRRLGSNWMGTTAGQQAMSAFTQKADLVREEARRGTITGEGGLLLAKMGYLGNVKGQEYGSFMQFPERTSNLFSKYGSAMQPYQQQRGMEFQAMLSNAQSKDAAKAGMMSGIGSLVGSGMQAYGSYAGMAALSSRIFKKNIATILSPLEKLKQIRGVEFDWKDESGHDSGVIAEEVEGVIPGIVDEINSIKHVRYHTLIPFLIEALKAQQEQIDKLQEKE